MQKRRGNIPGTRARQRARWRRNRVLLIAAPALAVVVLLAVLLIPKGERRNDVLSAAAPAATPAPTRRLEAAPTAAPEPTPGVAKLDRALTRPEATAEGFLPVFREADTTEKIVAITVDDCYQADNLRQIVDKAIEVGGKLTIFPIGENVLRSQQAEILKYAWENGFELENHTFTHNGLYRCSNQELAEEIYKQQMSLCYILGQEYQPHFLRPKGGDARNDQRIHKYVEQLGYYGIAHWSVSGGESDSKLGRALQPGAIYLFHTTDKDLDKLLRFIPWVVEQGYQLVTLNEMFGYPENETGPLETPINKHVMPTLAPFDRVLVTYKKTSYAYGVYLLQQKLIKLGYLKGEPDGVYGASCERAVKAFQKDHKLKADGIATPEVQERIFGA